MATPKPSYELTKDEARRLGERVKPIHDFFTQLQIKVDRRGPRYAKLSHVVSKVQDALQHLSVHLHYEETGWGGRPPGVKPPE